MKLQFLPSNGNQKDPLHGESIIYTDYTSGKVSYT